MVSSMRKYRICICAVFLEVFLLTLSHPPASADQAVVTGNGVNIRTGPGTAYAVSTSVDRDTEVEVLDRANPAWYLVSLDGNSGYISSQFLDLLEEDSSAVISVSGEETPGYINGMYVSFRSGPGTSFSVLGTYSTGKLLTITGISDEWTAVRIDGKDGFVYSQFVREGSPDAAEIQLDTTDSNGEFPVTSAGGTTIYLLQEQSSPTPEATLSPDQIVQVPTDGVVHTPAPSDPSPAAEIPVQTASEYEDALSDEGSSGTLITVTDPRLVTVAETAGESSPKPSFNPSTEPSPLVIEENDAVLPEESAESELSVETDSSAPVPDRKLGKITGNAVCLRSGPGTTYSIITTYDSGTDVVISGVSGDWTAVTVPMTGISGFIHSDYIQSVDPSDSTGEDPHADSGSPAYNPASFQSRDGYITGSSVRLRESPSMSARILDELNFGTSVRMIGVSEDWFRVIVNGREGYVSASFVAEGVFEPAAKLSSSTGTELGKEIASYALGFVGTPYKWGGKSPETGFDCSGFVQYVFGQFGYTTSRVANDALSDGVHVDPADLQPGDMLCFYSGSNYVGHLGIYVGNNMFVHAANSATGVVTTSLSTGYYATRGYEIRRITGK